MARKRSSKLRDPNAFLLRALEYARASADSGDASFVLTGGAQQTSTGTTVVHLRQVYAGIPVRDSGRSVRFDPQGAITHFTGSAVPVSAGTPVVPDVEPAAAVHAAFLSLLVTSSIPPDLTFSAGLAEVVAEIPLPSRSTVLRKTPFVEPILATLVIDASARKSRLLWDVRLGLPGGAGTWVAYVSATGDRPEVLSVQRLSAHAITGDVFEYDPRSAPAAGVPFPRPRTSYPSFGGKPLPNPDWVEQDLTDGNNTRAIGPAREPIRGARTGDDVVFTSGTVGDPDHWVINAFYWSNVMHDFFHLLGFDERAGNFQRKNHAGGGGAGDALSVVTRDEVISGLAFFQNRPDGTSPTLELGRFHQRHTALDADIVIHEFVHGVTSRVIGGKDEHTPLTKPQSRALGEGFSDYYAISIQNWFRRQAGQPEEWIYGAWIADRPTGLRTAPYDGYPNTYGLLRKPDMKPHIAGEVWCATLLDLNEALRDGGTRDQGDERGWQLVFDSLSFLHPGRKGPHFLHGRDAILSAFDGAVAQGSLPAALKKEVLDVFKKRGMGPGARSPDAEFRTVVEAFK